MKPLEPALRTDLLRRIQTQIGGIVVGKPRTLRLALACLLANGHLLIEDRPGVGKTTLARALASTLGLPFRRVQFTSDLLPADIIGVSIFDTSNQRFRFQPGPIFTSVLLADEINRAPPKTQSALLEGMEERQVTSDGETRALPDPFFVIATQNPAEQLGAFPLPESQIERLLLSGGDRRQRVDDLPALADTVVLRELRGHAAGLHVAPALLDYLQALLAKSRDGSIAEHGLSPRAGLYLLSAARAWAMLEGREMVVPDDLQAIFPAVAGHRLCGQGATGQAMAERILRTVAIP
jgi:MoxR-like ATPase